MKKLGVALTVLLVASFAGALYYYMPRATKVVITGTDVKRMDAKGTATGQTRDVRFVYAKDISDGKARVFRNEDNGWYFKWDSGDIAAEAMSMAQTETADMLDGKNDVVLAKYYGIRFPMLDLFPNILSLKKVSTDYVYVPIFNIVFLVVLLALFIWGGIKIRRLVRLARDRARKLARRGAES